MLDDLELEPLEVKGRHDRLSMLYRMQYNLVDKPANRYLSLGDSCTRGTVKFFQERINDTNYSNSFFPRTAREWNNLPSIVMSAASLEEFRPSLSVRPAPLLTSEKSLYIVLTSFINLYIVFGAC